jgi:two-component system, OmpR family, KDP operon response regulator KdpE
MTGELILLIEDEPQMRRFLRIALQGEGYRLIEAATGHDGLREAASRNPSVVLLDLGLPDIDGIEVARMLRQWSAVPIIVLSARGQEDDKVRALDAGADDYLTKPFGAGELMARIRVALRHAGAHAPDEPVFSIGSLTVDMAMRRVTVDEVNVHLTPTEYKLLAVLVRHAGKVITHGQLMREVWGPAYANQTHYLRIYMAQLRHKLEPDPARPRYFMNEPGVGYRLKIT